MPAALYPQVPNVPGVPSLLRLGSYSLPPQVLSAADMLGLNQLLGAQQWGIYSAATFSGGQSSGVQSVLPFDAVLEVSMARDFDVPDFPIENGGFASFNKVARPYDARVSFAVGSSSQMRQDALAVLDNLVADLNSYSVVTPERVYSGANIVHYDYERSVRQGVTLLVVRVWVKEVRQVATATYSNTQSPNGAGNRRTGAVQGASPSAAVTSSVTAAGVQ